jgi:hypothetical protein
MTSENPNLSHPLPGESGSLSRSNGHSSPHTALREWPTPDDSAPSPQAQIGCDLAEGNTFYPFSNHPPIPVLAEFGAGSLHQCRMEGTWDIDKAVAELPGKLVRSFSKLKPGGKRDSWEDLVFRLAPRCFLAVNTRRAIGYASTADLALQLTQNFHRDYEKSPEATGGSFQLIRCERDDICCECVTLEPETIFDEQGLHLRYPDGGLAWHKELVEALHKRKSGFTILEGPPGTGKTTYLRHLMGVLMETHRFYYIPPSSMEILSKPDFIGFWAAQRREHSGRRLVVILEDADSAVMARSSDNREQVSAVLNLSDGMLGDFLALQIICTINCPASEIDQALLRPGRLTSHRIFTRLAPADAASLAASLGINLPQAGDFSLAEIFSGKMSTSSNRPAIGFHG